jgi:hypothetical protein
MRWLHTDSHGIRYYVERELTTRACLVATALAHVAKWLIVLGERVFALALRKHPGIHWER